MTTSTVREPSEDYASVPVSERLAQCIWYDQRFKRDALKLADGRNLKVLNAGMWNLESGPDFRCATIQIGDGAPVTGDVEIHLCASDWRNHGHEHDARYRNVVLHAVMWEEGLEPAARTADGRPLPQFVMLGHLDSPLEELYDSIDTDGYPYAAHDHAGQCESILQTMPATAIMELLAEAGDERLAAKARKFTRWARRGTEQAFYEGFMEALGYKANKTPFRLLAQRFTLEDARTHRTRDAKETALRFEAILLGLGGLLPEKATKHWDTASKHRAKLLWDYWWRWRAAMADKALRRDQWNFANLRPANHPQRRLATAAAFLAANPRPLQKALAILRTNDDPRATLTKLMEWLCPAVTGDFWETHFTLGGRAQKTPSALLGRQRSAEIILNAILPAVLAAAALQGGKYPTKGATAAAVAGRVNQSYNALPRLPSHSIECLMYQRLFAGRAEKPYVLMPTARHQQGLLQIFHDFCLNNTSNCQSCRLPELLEQRLR